MDFVGQLVTTACYDNGALLTKWIGYLVSYGTGTVTVGALVHNFRNYLTKMPGGDMVVTLAEKAALRFVTDAADKAAKDTVKVPSNEVKS